MELNAPGVKNVVSGAIGLGLHFGYSLSSSVTLCNLLNPSVPRFPHLHRVGDNCSACLSTVQGALPHVLGVVSVPYIL